MGNWGPFFLCGIFHVKRTVPNSPSREQDRLSIVINVKPSVPVIEIPVIVSNRADDPAGIPDGDNTVGDILCDHAAGSDHDIVAHCHAGHYTHVAADPHIITYRNVYSILITRIA